MIKQMFSFSDRQKSRKWALVLAYVFLVIFIIFFLFPPFYMLVTSFKTNEEISSLKGIPFIINQGATLYHYKKLLTETLFLTYFKNTVIVTFFSVSISMIISILAAYSLARMRFWGSGVLVEVGNGVEVGTSVYVG